jgi:uncharacterized membrane protein
LPTQKSKEVSVKKLTRYFLEGLLFLVPVGVTLYVLYFVFSKVDHIFRFRIPGMGFLMTIAIVTAMGFFVSTFLARRLVVVIDRLFTRMPLVKIIYSSIKDLINAFVGEKKRFSQPVLVALAPGSSVKIMGFVTRGSMEAIGMAESVAVYIPQSYNFAGNVIVVPRDQLTPVAAESGSVMTFIVSGGVSGLI